MTEKENCFYYEEGECIGNDCKCSDICGYYKQKYNILFSLACVFIISSIIYGAGFIIYGFGRASGKQERVSRATCMSHIIDMELEGKHVKWVGKK